MSQKATQDSIHMQSPEQASLETESTSAVARSWREGQKGELMELRGIGFLLGVMKRSWKSYKTLVMVAQVCYYIKNQWNVHLRRSLTWINKYISLKTYFYVLWSLGCIHRMEDLQPTHVTGIPVEIHTVLPIPALSHRSIRAQLFLGFRCRLLFLCFFLGHWALRGCFSAGRGSWKRLRG